MQQMFHICILSSFVSIPNWLIPDFSQFPEIKQVLLTITGMKKPVSADIRILKLPKWRSLFIESAANLKTLFTEFH
ncbi:MAG: hypothetical protein ACJAYR_001260 [Sneathiella sp.]|jgi:hypothetical protein